MPSAEVKPWQERYPEKVATAGEAVACVQHGQRVFIGSGAGEPQELVDALFQTRGGFDLGLSQQVGQAFLVDLRGIACLITADFLANEYSILHGGC